MLDSEKDKLNRLEELKRKLSNTSYKTKIEYHDNYSALHHENVAESWQEDLKPQTEMSNTKIKTSIFKKFFIFSVICFLVASLYVGYKFFAGGNTVSNEKIDIAILGNTFTGGGEDLPLQIEITNNNNASLELVDLVVEYPNGSVKTGSNLGSDTERIRSSLGTIPSGGVRSENMNITLFGEQGTTNDIKISIEYRVEGSNAIFIKEKDYQVTISSTPIDLVVEGPTEINPGEDVVVNVRTLLNASKPALGMMVKVDYPLGFQFVKSTPSPSLGNNIWSLGDLSPGAEGKITIIGRMIDVSPGEEKTFKVYTGSQAKNDKSTIGVVFNSLGYNVQVKKPFIAARLYVNGVYDREYAIDSRTPVQAEINYVNNLDTEVNDLEIRAKISGNGFNRNSIRAPKGYYDSLNNTIIWNKDYDNKLAEVSPYQGGSVSFFVSPLSLFLPGGGFLKQPTINIEVTISGRQALEGNVSKKLDNSESKTMKVITDLGLGAKVVYYSGPFKNSGPLPPKAETETTYTVVWTITNSANNVSKAQVTSSLPPFIKFLGTVNPMSEDFSYNASTREIVWKIGSVPTGTGITGASREVAFQISLTPSLAQIDEVVKLINEAILTGHDDFANVDVRATKPFLNTSLTNDPSFPKNGAKVVE